MKLTPTSLGGVYIIEQDVHKDSRGAFVKMFQRSFFAKYGLEGDYSENYYTRSHEDVIRGMHFQAPPADHAKLVTVIQGTIIDVILDIRKASPTYGKFIEIELSRENRRSIYIPRGCAHGFGTLSETAIAYYMVSSEYDAAHDAGIRYDSFGYDWPIPNPIMSDRDKSFLPFSSFRSPF
jgi:dTDP-4-dehydrorhamnose 3,5-epimerase